MYTKNLVHVSRSEKKKKHQFRSACKEIVFELVPSHLPACLRALVKCYGRKEPKKCISFNLDARARLEQTKKKKDGEFPPSTGEAMKFHNPTAPIKVL